MKLLLDMDGVIVDFVRGSHEFHKRDCNYKAIRWDFAKELFPEDESKFWQPLGREFWGNLEWLPGGRQLFQGLVKLCGIENIAICTSPCASDGCIDGKMDWIKREIPALARQFLVTPIKHFAAQGNLLLDDNEPNCKKFTEAGGKAILVDAPWNKYDYMLDQNGDYDWPALLEEVEDEWLS